MTTDFDENKVGSNLVAFSDALGLIDETLINAGHHLYIKARSLNHPLLTHKRFIDSLKNKLVLLKRFNCRILLEEIRPSKASSHFVNYYQRLTDYIEIRRFKPEHASADRRQYIIVDTDLLAWQSHDQRNDMRVFEDAHRIQDFTDAFESDWKNSNRDLSLLKLYI